jgi:hypothetical protein
MRLISPVNTFCMGKEAGFMRTVRMLMCLAAMMAVAGSCFGEDPDDNFIPLDMQFGFFGGAGVANPSGNASHGSLHLGASIGTVRPNDYDKKHHVFLFGLSGEAGYAGPVDDLGNGSALLSMMVGPEIIVSHHKRITAFATGGYTRLFGTGNALNIGSGLNFYIKDNKRALRFEVRDYWHTAGVREHNAAFRIGYLFCDYDR